MEETTKGGVGSGNPCTPHKPVELLILEVTRNLESNAISALTFFNYEFKSGFWN